MKRGEVVEDSPVPDRAKPAKRVKLGHRASIACFTCRKRKVRCDSEYPKCGFCGTKNLECKYEGHPREANNQEPEPKVVKSPTLIKLPPIDVILSALDAFFTHHYDTFYFLHKPSLEEAIRNQNSPLELLCCILSFACSYHKPLQVLHESPSAGAEYYSTLAMRLLNDSGESANPESEFTLTRCQCLLILGVYEICRGSENRGWMLLGSAYRMTQVLRLADQDDAESASSSIDPILAESKRRTFWACYLLDRTLTDGKERPTSLRTPLSATLRMPGPDPDFQAGKRSIGPRFEANLPPWKLSVKDTHIDIEADLYGHILRVSEIFNSTITYIGCGGRNIDRLPPWTKESTAFRLTTDLRDWFNGLPNLCHYSEPNLIAHSLVGQGRLWGMLQLLYCTTVILLRRDYLPFLPPIDYSAANGPCDGEPLWSENGIVPEAPPGYWAQMFSEGLAAACTVSDLLTMLDKHGSRINHPFAGFAIVTASTFHAHAKYWPKCNATAFNATTYLEKDIRILQSLKDMYPLASSWIDGVLRLAIFYENHVIGLSDANSDYKQIRTSVVNPLRKADNSKPNTPVSSETATPRVAQIEMPEFASPPMMEQSFVNQFPTLFNIYDLPSMDNVPQEWNNWNDFELLNVGGIQENYLWPLGNTNL